MSMKPPIGGTIMIIDDEPENLRVLATLLSQQGYTVRSFPNAKAALTSVKTDPPDLILLDIRMPDMDGFAFCAQLKATPSLTDIPVLFLSAADDVANKVRAFAQGGADYITKPFQAEEVLSRIGTHLVVSRYRTELETLNRDLEALVRERTADLLDTNRLLREEVDAHRTAQKALAESEKNFRRIVTTANEAILTADASYTITYANQVALNLFRASNDQLIGTPVISLIHEDDRPVFSEHMQARRSGKRDIYECRIRRLDGDVCWVSVSASPMIDANDRFTGAMAMLTDITERKHAEIALRQSKEFNQTVLMSLPDHIAVLDRSGGILVVNDSWIRFVEENDAGAINRIAIGADYLDVCRQSALSGSDDARRVLDGIQSVLDGRESRFRLEYACHSPQAERWFLMTVVPFNGRKGGVIVSHHDITERKRSELELEQAVVEIDRLKRQVEADKAYLQEEIKLEHDYDQIIGNSDEIKYVLYRLEQVARTDATVIILGETGTGKELIARALHATSKRASRPLVKVNCATLPEPFIESELFGHVKGAFTDARKDRQGRFELANGGTIFLDEIGELPMALQPKLLRVLQDGEFERLGDNRTIRTDVRVIAATNRDIEMLVKAGGFRSDLWYRINVFPITVPPLRDRPDDILLLVRHFIRKTTKAIGREITDVPEVVLDALNAYDWPGNVRELEHVIERAIISSSGKQLQLPEPLVSSAIKTHPEGLKSHADMEHEHILRVLNQTGWVIEGLSGAARILDIHPNTLRYRMKKLGIHRPTN